MENVQKYIANRESIVTQHARFFFSFYKKNLHFIYSTSYYCVVNSVFSQIAYIMIASLPLSDFFYNGTKQNPKGTQQIKLLFIEIANFLPFTLQCSFIVVFVTDFIQIRNRLLEGFTIDDQAGNTIFRITNDIGCAKVITRQK